MTAKELKNLKPGDRVRIRNGFANSGMHVLVLEVVPQLKTLIRFELGGKTMIWPHDRFVKAAPQGLRDSSSWRDQLA